MQCFTSPCTHSFLTFLGRRRGAVQRVRCVRCHRVFEKPASRPDAALLNAQARSVDRTCTGLAG